MSKRYDYWKRRKNRTYVTRGGLFGLIFNVIYDFYIDKKLSEFERQQLLENYGKRFASDIPEKKIYPKVHLNEFLDSEKSEGQIKENLLYHCPNCKKNIPDDSRFCIYCGTELKK
ncbi:MAG: zinc ribbon domain-containing protein [Promethearchaeota archaeon]